MMIHYVQVEKNEKELLCQWCRNNMNNIVTATEKFNVSGGDI